VKINQLAVEGWRNLEPLTLAFGPQLSVLHGDNGQGKSNVLEAVYFLATLRSFRTSRNDDLIRRGDPAGRARAAAAVTTHGLARRFEVELRPGGRIARLDGKLVRGVAAVLGSVSVVLFVPEDLLLARAPPAARRRFIDMAVFNVERGYFGEASAFQKVLKSRNALLRRGDAQPLLLDTYDQELARTGARVIVRRRALVAELVPRFAEHFAALHSNLPVQLRYRGHPDLADIGDEPALEQALLRGLAARRAIDERRRTTGFGPHLDDLEIDLAGAPARAHASQGQLRSLVLALKLAELTHVEARTGDAPVLLLDDVPSELDPERRRLLFESVAPLACQTLITVTERDLVPSFAERQDFLVRGGRVTPVSGPP